MKILYGLTTVGNGHITRAQAIIPKLKKYADVDVLLSGPGYGLDVDLGFPVKYRSEGPKFDITKRGRINIEKTITDSKVIPAIRDIQKLNLDEYNFVITDSDPISAWAARIQNKKCLSFGNIVALKSKRFKKKVETNIFNELYVNYSAPGDAYIAISYEKFEPWIFTPIIKDNIRNIKVTEGSHYTVYLHGYTNYFLSKKFNKIKNAEWHVFSKEVKEERKEGNTTFYPIDENKFIESLASCKGFVTSAGFSATSEALFLGKKMLIVPVNHFEQKMNADMLKKMGVKVIRRINFLFGWHLNNWNAFFKPIKKNYPKVTDKIVEKMIEFPNTEIKKRGLPKLKNYKKIESLIESLKKKITIGHLTLRK